MRTVLHLFQLIKSVFPGDRETVVQPDGHLTKRCSFFIRDLTGNTSGLGLKEAGKAGRQEQ